MTSVLPVCSGVLQSQILDHVEQQRLGVHTKQTHQFQA